MRKDTQERNDYIVELIKETKDGVPAGEIDKDCSLTAKRRSLIMAKLMQEYPQIKRYGTYRVPVYFWIDDIEEKPAKPERPVVIEKPNRNKEGYVDMTASTAISNVSQPKITRISVEPADGEVWSCEEANGTPGYIYIIAIVSNAVQCVKLYDTASSTGPAIANRPLDVSIHKRRFTGDLERVCFKPMRYLKNRVKTRDDEQFQKVMTQIFDIFNADCYYHAPDEAPATKVEPQVIVKTVIPEGYLSKDEVERKVKDAESAIWHEVALKLLDRR